MYCKLKDNFLLRGWKLLPTGIVNKTNGQIQFLSQARYNAIKKCDGLHEENSFSAEESNFVLNSGLVDKIETPSALRAEQEYKFYDNRFMASVHWLITGKCNARCKHCYMSAPDAVFGEPSHELCMNIIDKMAACGIQSVTLSGGDPLIRKDFWEIVDSLLSHGIFIEKVMTNGLLLNDSLLDKFEARGIKPSIQMSFDGTDGWHDWMRGIKGAEKAVVHAFDICHKRGFDTSCGFCWHKGNRHVLHDSLKLLGSLGVGSVKVNNLDPVGAAENIREYAMTFDEYFNEMLKYIPQYIEDGAPVPVRFQGMFVADDAESYRIGLCKTSEDKPNDNSCLCGAMRNSMTIDPEGRMLPCGMFNDLPALYKKYPNIKDVAIKDLLTKSAYFDFINIRLKEFFRHNTECAACEFKYRCGSGCRGRAILKDANHDIWAADKGNCTFFKGGYYSRLIDFMDDLNVKRLGA